MIDVRLAMLGATMWVWAAVLRPLKRVVPLETLVRLMHRRPLGPRSPALEARLEGYIAQRARFPFRAPANCLERSLAAYRVLCARNAAPELVIGFRRTAGEVRGHVWRTVDGRPLGESSATLANYTAVEVFDSEGRRRGGAQEGAERLSAVRFQ